MNTNPIRPTIVSEPTIALRDAKEALQLQATLLSALEWARSDIDARDAREHLNHCQLACLGFNARVGIKLIDPDLLIGP